MSRERPTQRALPSPHEVFGFTDQEHLHQWVNHGRFQGILNDDQTTIHRIGESSGGLGDFLSVTISRPASQQRICLTFYGLGFHEYRERWLTDEWHWYEDDLPPAGIEQTIHKEKVGAVLQGRRESISPHVRQETQTERGRVFEMVANRMNAEDGREELKGPDLLASLIRLAAQVDGVCYAEVAAIMTNSEREPPTGKNLLDPESRERLPELYSGEDKGLDALAQVKFFTPDSNWTWFASEFDGEDSFFGLVVGFEIELGYFSLSELQSVRGTWGLAIERDLYYEPKTLRELQEMHQRHRRG